MWMTVAGVRVGRPTGPHVVLLVNRTRSAVLPIAVDDRTAVAVSEAYGSGVSAGGLDLLMAVVSGLGARIQHVALARAGTGAQRGTDPSDRGCAPPTPGGRRVPDVRASSASIRRPRVRLADVAATVVLTGDRRVVLPAAEALALATRCGVPVDVNSPLRDGTVALGGLTTAAVTGNAVEDTVDELRLFLAGVRAADFGG